MKHIGAFLGVIRAPFLILAPACVFAGYGSAKWSQGAVTGKYIFLAFLGALAAHVGVNALNEYYDFVSGLDIKTSRTPFSGGSGTIPLDPSYLPLAKYTGWIAAVFVVVIGLYFIWIWGWGILPLGLFGLVLIVFYTTVFNRLPFFCLIAPGLGFGLFMIMGTDFVLTGRYTWTAFLASLPSFFLVSNLLLLNQFPDLEADQEVGRKHFPIVFGRKRSSLVYALFLFLAYVPVVVGVVLGLMPAFVLLSLIGLVIAVPVALGVYRNAEQIEKLMPFMGMNVILNIITPVLIGLGFLLG